MIVISDGIALGKVVIKKNNYNIEKININNPEEEKNKFLQAKKKCLEGLEELKKFTNEDNVSFIDAHILMVNDASLQRETLKIIEQEHVNAEYAFTRVIDRYINLIKDSKDEYLQERYLDIKDIKIKMIRAILNEQDVSKIDYDYIVFTDEVLPSLLLHSNRHLKGIVSKNGGFTSHSAILANALGVVYIISDIEAKEGDLVVLDGSKNEIIINPSEDDAIKYKNMMNTQKEIDLDKLHKKFDICANISSNIEIDNLKLINLNGVGLYRSEFIFFERNTMPSYDEQKSIYKTALDEIYPKPVTIRTIDLGDDKKIDYINIEKKGVENYYTHKELFDTQIKALVDANEKGNLRIMFPMIKTKDEFIGLKERVLKMSNGKKMEIGMMVETKEALDNISQFECVDFFSLGTNDLLQELYGVKRDSAFDYKEYLDDLRVKLRPLVEYCKKNNKPLSVCGELASKPDAIKMMVEIGIKKFSVGINNVYTLYNTLRNYV